RARDAQHVLRTAQLPESRGIILEQLEVLRSLHHAPGKPPKPRTQPSGIANQLSHEMQRPRVLRAKRESPFPGIASEQLLPSEIAQSAYIDPYFRRVRSCFERPVESLRG